MIKNLKYFQVAVSAIFLLLLSPAFFAQPQVSKVEPPNWWANHTINPVRLLVRGANFQGAKVSSANKSLQVSNIRVNSRGDYLFFDVSIAPDAKPAKYEFEVATAGGKTKIPFEVSASLKSPKDAKSITNEDILYLIITDRFANGDPANDAKADRRNPRLWHGGDFRGIINKLDYLQEVGVTTLWLSPWYDNSDEEITCDKPWCPMSSYHGFGAIDYYGVENHFGSFAELQELIEQAHARGIKIVQDQVANHASYRHPWMKNPPLDDWFTSFKPNSFNDSILLSPNSTPAERESLLKGWFDFSLPDMNYDQPEVAKYQIQNALWWVGMTGIDGIRQDTIQYMPRSFIREWSKAIRRQYPDYWMVGEILEMDAAHTAFFQGGKTGWDGIDTELPAVFDFLLWETSWQVFTGKKPARALREVLKYDGLYSNVNRISTVQNNHDTDRFMSQKDATKEGAKLHAALMLAMRGIPQLYYGEEILMQGGYDPDNRRDFPGGWKEDKISKFEKTGRTADEQEMFETVKWWVKTRRASDALKYGKTLDLYYDDNVYVFARQTEKETVIIGFNSSAAPQTVEIRESDLSLAGRKLAYVAKDLKGAESPRQTAVNDLVKISIPSKNAVFYNVLIGKN